jgi:hypothetical protein
MHERVSVDDCSKGFINKRLLRVLQINVVMREIHSGAIQAIPHT